MPPTHSIDAHGRLWKWFGTNTDIDAQKTFAQRRERIARGLTEMIVPGMLPAIRNMIVDGAYMPAEEDAR